MDACCCLHFGHGHIISNLSQLKSSLRVDVEHTLLRYNQVNTSVPRQGKSTFLQYLVDSALEYREV